MFFRLFIQQVQNRQLSCATPLFSPACWELGFQAWAQSITFDCIPTERHLLLFTPDNLNNDFQLIVRLGRDFFNIIQLEQLLF